MDVQSYLQMQYMNSMGQIVAAMKKGDMKLAQSLPLPEVKDIRLETIKKVEASKVAWQLYREPMWTKAEAESQFCQARKWIDDFHQQLQYQNLLVGNRDKIRYHNHLDNVKPTITDNRTTYAYNINTANYDILVKYAYAIDKQHFTKCCVKTISSSSIDLFSTIRKTLRIGSESGLSRDQLVELLLDLIKDEVKGLAESVQNREMTADQIFYRITSCLSEEHDLEKIQIAIMRIKRHPGQPLSMVANALERLHLEMLQCMLPFSPLSALEERNKLATLELICDFTEQATAESIRSYIATCNNSGRPFSLKDVLYFADQYETLNGKKPRKTLSIAPGTFKANAFFNNISNNVMLAASPARGNETKQSPKGFGQKPKEKKKPPFTRGGKPVTKGKTGDTSGAQKTQNNAAKGGKGSKKAANKPKPGAGKKNNYNGCILCGWRCWGDVDYKGKKCKLFPNTKLADKTCQLCGRGRHISSSTCYEMFRMFSGNEKN